MLSERCDNLAGHRGSIITILGRHKHFSLWGPPRWAKNIVPKRKEEAVEEFGLPIKRWFTYKALNNLIQGSAADMVKKAMVMCHKAGHIPNLTVHDELDFADISSDKQIKEIEEIMVTYKDRPTIF